MCLITEQKKPIKIRKDLTVYKAVSLDGKNISSWSADYDFEYKLNVLHKENMVSNNIFESYADHIVSSVYNVGSKELTHVHNGFHSAKDILRIMHFKHYADENKGFTKCIIPKGSLVFKDKTGLIVSNQIILKEIL